MGSFYGRCLQRIFTAHAAVGLLLRLHPRIFLLCSLKRSHVRTKLVDGLNILIVGVRVKDDTAS